MGRKELKMADRSKSNKMHNGKDAWSSGEELQVICKEEKKAEKQMS